MVWRIPIFFVFYLYYKKKRLNDCWISLRKLILFGYWVEIFNVKKCIWRKVLCVWRNGLSYSISVSVEKKEIILVYYFSNAVYFLFNINFKCNVTDKLFYKHFTTHWCSILQINFWKKPSVSLPPCLFGLKSQICFLLPLPPPHHTPTHATATQVTESLQKLLEPRWAWCLHPKVCVFVIWLF